MSTETTIPARRLYELIESVDDGAAAEKFDRDIRKAIAAAHNGDGKHVIKLTLEVERNGDDQITIGLGVDVIRPKPKLQRSSAYVHEDGRVSREHPYQRDLFTVQNGGQAAQA